MSAYFVQVGIILFPICIYQIWTFGKSFSNLPLRVPLLGLYGGAAAILCQQLPVNILGQSENFQCIPIVLAFLYGKRRAGLLAIAILCGYQVVIGQPNLPVSFLAIAIYAIVPFLICNQFTRMSSKRRILAGIGVSVVTLAVEWLFLAVFLIVIGGPSGRAIFVQHCRMLGVASVIQFSLMLVAFLLLENILQNGRIRNRHDSLIHYNPLAICAVDNEDRFTAVNAAYEQLSGYTEAELIGQSRFTVWFPEDAASAHEAVQRLHDSDVNADFEFTFRHKSGRAIEVRSTIVPIVEGDERVGFFAMMSDITDAKMAEELLRNSEKLAALGELAAGVAHEIRNPLTALKGFLQLIPETDNPDRYIKIMQAELTRIEAIVSELLVLAKPQAAEFVKVDIRRVMADVLPLVHTQADMKSVVLVPRFSKGPLLIDGIPNQLKQVFLNVIQNAIEAVDTGGRVNVHLESIQETREICVRVRDNGQGMPEDVLKRIGEPFFTTKESGTGLGLLVCKRIMTNHDGSLHFTSEVGKGTEAKILFPLTE